MTKVAGRRFMENLSRFNILLHLQLQMLFEMLLDLLLKNITKSQVYSLSRVDTSSENFANFMKFRKISHLNVFSNLFQLN